MPFVIHWADSCTGVEEITGIDTPAGRLIIYSRSGVICSADWESEGKSIQYAETNLQQELRQFWLDLDKPIHLTLLKQGTPFRNRVWAELCRIPFGATLTYSALAGKIGSAPRAVGNACRDNPFPLIIPCHRVVSVYGLGGYSGQIAGRCLDIKRKLLAFEHEFSRAD